MKNNIDLLNFIDLNLDEKKMILSWRNNPIIKKWMYTQDNITLENHLKFIDTLSKTKDKLYFLVKKDQEYIGVIDFTNITPEDVYMGIYTNPYKKGVGSILLDTIISHAFEVLTVKKLFAEVFNENVKAKNLYLTFGFKEYKTISINNKEVSCMELDNN